MHDKLCGWGIHHDACCDPGGKSSEPLKVLVRVLQVLNSLIPLLVLCFQDDDIVAMSVSTGQSEAFPSLLPRYRAYLFNSFRPSLHRAGSEKQTLCLIR